MSYSYWWVLLKIKAPEYQGILPHYLEMQTEVNNWRKRSINYNWENGASTIHKSSISHNQLLISG